MLILSRKKNECVVVGNKILVTVVEIRDDKVRLAVNCPPGVPVYREELSQVSQRPSPPLATPPRSHEEIGFLQAILESPDDEGIRLIFADWLEEQGDPRGEFIRTQCQKANLPPGDRGRQLLEQRERDLLQAHGALWKSYLPAVLQSSVFERGFVETAHLTIPEFLDNAEAIFSQTPLRQLRIWHPWDIPMGPIATLADSPYLARLAGLDLSGQNLGDSETALLAESPYLGSLQVLTLRRNRIGDAGAVILANSSSLASLTILDLASNRIGEVGAKALAAAPSLAGLSRLYLADNALGEDGARTLRRRFGDRVRLGRYDWL